MGGHVRSSWNLSTTTHHGGTTIIGGWPIVGWLTSSPLTSGPIGRSTCKWLIDVSPIGISPIND
jgi:hypothetical protein